MSDDVWLHIYTLYGMVIVIFCLQLLILCVLAIMWYKMQRDATIAELLKTLK